MIASSGFWYLASYPKSGNTWLRILLKEYKRLFDVAHGSSRSSVSDPRSLPVNINTDIKTGAIASSRQWLNDQIGVNTCNLTYSDLDPLRGYAGQSSHVFAMEDRYHKVHDAFRSPQSLGRPVVCPGNCNGAVYMIRNPEDVVVSLAHHMGFSLGESVEFMLNPSAKMAASETAGSSQVRQFLGSWAAHVKSWTSQSVIPIHLVRYEDLLGDGLTTFSGLLSFLGIPEDLGLVDKALSNTSIAKLQQQEQALGGFVEAGVGPGFFRSGRSGEGKEKLEPGQIIRINNAFRDVMTEFGYHEK